MVRNLGYGGKYGRKQKHARNSVFYSSKDNQDAWEISDQSPGLRKNCEHSKEEVSSDKENNRQSLESDITEVLKELSISNELPQESPPLDDSLRRSSVTTNNTVLTIKYDAPPLLVGPASRNFSESSYASHDSQGREDDLNVFKRVRVIGVDTSDSSSNSSLDSSNWGLVSNYSPPATFTNQRKTSYAATTINVPVSGPDKDRPGIISPSAISRTTGRISSQLHKRMSISDFGKTLRNLASRRSGILRKEKDTQVSGLLSPLHKKSMSLLSLSSSQKEHEFDKTMISLPKPLEASREKLRSKLRSSISLMSLAQSDLDGSSGTVAIPVEEYGKTNFQSLLDLCTDHTVHDFKAYIEQVCASGPLQKLAEASFSEVFSQQDRHSSRIFKIIPFGNEDLDQLPVQDIIKELTISRILMTLEGYSKVLDSVVVRGKYPEKLLELWDKFKIEGESENIRPDVYGDNQFYCIILMPHSGIDLEHFKLNSWQEAESIFWQVVRYLSDAESRFNFEHRDLHWGNITVKCKNESSENKDKTVYAPRDLSVTLIDYTLSRATDSSGKTICSRLDHPDFFRGVGDYQFDIYRLMRTCVSSLSTTDSTGQSINWSVYCPRTNVLWLHYVLDKLLNAKGLDKTTQFKMDREMRKEKNSYMSLVSINRCLDPRKTNTKKPSSGLVEFQNAQEVYHWGISNKFTAPV